jgi:flavin reductase (DIM6/NTAB) family NADH-FMN oxidoreductase RutF
MRSASTFVVNVIGETHANMCRAFVDRLHDQKWTGLRWRPAPLGAPILDDAIAWIECRYGQIHEVGDHYIVIGCVQTLKVTKTERPLLLSERGFGRLVPLVDPSARTQRA